MKIEEIDIKSLLPQREPMLMIDRLTDFDERGAQTEFTIKADNIFVRDGHLSEAGLMENIAQTCAARIGYVNSVLKHEGVKIGIIGAVKNFEVEFMPAVGEQLTTRVEVESEVFNITLVSAQVLCRGQKVASCTMKISLTDIES